MNNIMPILFMVYLNDGTAVRGYVGITLRGKSWTLEKSIRGELYNKDFLTVVSEGEWILVNKESIKMISPINGEEEKYNEENAEKS